MSETGGPASKRLRLPTRVASARQAPQPRAAARTLLPRVARRSSRRLGPRACTDGGPETLAMSEDDSRSAEPRSILRSSSMTDMQWQCSASDELMGSDEVRLSLCEPLVAGASRASPGSRRGPHASRRAARGATAASARALWSPMRIRRRCGAGRPCDSYDTRSLTLSSLRSEPRWLKRRLRGRRVQRRGGAEVEHAQPACGAAFSKLERYCRLRLSGSSAVNRAPPEAAKLLFAKPGHHQGAAQRALFELRYSRGRGARLRRFPLLR